MNERVRHVLMTAGKRNVVLLKVPTLIIPQNIGKYAAKNGPARAIWHLSVLEMTVHEKHFR